MLSVCPLRNDAQKSQSQKEFPSNKKKSENLAFQGYSFQGIHVTSQETVLIQDADATLKADTEKSKVFLKQTLNF